MGMSAFASGSSSHCSGKKSVVTNSDWHCLTSENNWTQKGWTDFHAQKLWNIKKKGSWPKKAVIISKSYQLLTILRHNQTNKHLSNGTSFWCNIRHLCVHRKPGGHHRVHHHLVPVHVAQLRRQELGQSSGVEVAVYLTRHPGKTRFCYHLRWTFLGPTGVEVVCHVLDTDGKL